MNSRIRLIIFAVIGLFIAFVLLDSLGTFDSKSWVEIPHGNHSHYLPKKECTPKLTVSQGSTRQPGPGETVNCQGKIVPDDGS